MLFNSGRFLEFFVVVYALYLALDHKRQNRLLLAASYFFYGSWDWRYLSLLLLTTSIDYWAALAIQRSTDEVRRRVLLSLSVAANLGMLGFFKYYDFFAENLAALLHSLGVAASPHLLHLLLPWGISFYTFQSMSYTIDVYRGELVPAGDFFDFSLFVTFFPHLVAGPIMRATQLLPQVLAPREVTREKFYEGCHLFFWGLFQKVAVADTLAPLADAAFRPASGYRAADVLVGVYAFAFQVYGDFAGYSNMARGLGKCMGFEIAVNFNLPYFATNPADFWRRWHISLSTWLKDYLFDPIVIELRDWGNTGVALSVVATFLLAGLWHGAGWHFILFGAYFSVLIILHQIFQRAVKKRPALKAALDSGPGFLVRLAVFFHLTMLGWIIFRAPTVAQAAAMLRGLAAHSGALTDPGAPRALALVLFIPLLVELWQFRKNDLLAVYRCPAPVKAAFYLACYFFMRAHGASDSRQFIYFQF